MFKQEMKAAGADFKFISYPGAVHSFTNPDADAAERIGEIPIEMTLVDGKIVFEV